MLICGTMRDMSSVELSLDMSIEGMKWPIRVYCCISVMEDVCRETTCRTDRFIRDSKVVLDGYVTPIIMLFGSMSAKGPLGWPARYNRRSAWKEPWPTLCWRML